MDGKAHNALATKAMQDVNEKVVLTQHVLSLSFRWVSFWAPLMPGATQMTLYNMTDFSLLTCTLNILSASTTSQFPTYRVPESCSLG